MSRVVFIRHAESTFNAFRDASNNPGLSERGKSQASSLNGHFDIVLCSSLKRARETLERSGITYNKLIITPLLRERKSHHPSDYFPNETISPENNQDFIFRMKEIRLWLDKLSKRYKNIVVISHGYVLASLTGKLFGNAQVISAN